ncbi:MAG: hypothetical protein ACI9MR_003659 [Myxococcota bacterium]|jgi:hypothetical protein
MTRSALSTGLYQGTWGRRAALSAPWTWVPKTTHAMTVAHNSAKHLIYIRMRAGFRFTAAFNGDVADQFNAFGRTEQKAVGAEWAATRLLDRAPWLDGEAGDALRARGMLSVSALADQLAVIPCVDH